MYKSNFRPKNGHPDPVFSFSIPKAHKESCQKKHVFWGGYLSQICLPTHPAPTPWFLWDLGKRKVKFGSKKAIFGEIWGGFEGFGPCLGISHPTHPHLGKILAASLKNNAEKLIRTESCSVTRKTCKNLKIFEQYFAELCLWLFHRVGGVAIIGFVGPWVAGNRHLAPEADWWPWVSEMRGWQIDKDNDSLKRRKDSWRYYRGGQIGREICFLPGCPKMSKNEPSDQLTSRAMSVKYWKEAAAAFDRMKKGLVLPLTMTFWTIWWLLFWDSWSILQTVVFVQSYGHRRCALLVGWDWLSIWGLWQNHPFWPPDPPGATPVAAHKYTASWNTSITTEYTSHPATNTRKTVHINRVS